MIDLTGTAPIIAVVADGGDSGVVQDANDIRPQSSVGLFCDMEVAVRGPAGEGAKAALLPAAGAESRAAKLDQAPRRTTARDKMPRIAEICGNGLSAPSSDGAPLLMGTVLAALMGRVRLEPVDSNRERRFREVDRLGREPRN